MIDIKFKKLSKKQKRRQKVMTRKIKTAKEQAKMASHGVQHKYVILATQNLQQLYSSPRFSRDNNFLLRRYMKLENNNNIWLVFMLPVFMSMLYDCVKDLLLPLLKTVAPELQSITSLLLASPSQITPSVIVMLLFILLLLAGILYSLCLIIHDLIISISRDAESTIRENELNIIKKILIDNKILIE